jgi:hypothetical protein
MNEPLVESELQGLAGSGSRPNALSRGEILVASYVIVAVEPSSINSWKSTCRRSKRPISWVGGIDRYLASDHLSSVILQR